MALINKNLGLDPDTYRSQRAKKILKNQNLDEIFSMSALADIAPGYTTKVQSIKKLINTKKASEIDLPFQRIINALNEGKTSMQLNKKIVPIEDAIKDFNKNSAKFSKKNKILPPAALPLQPCASNSFNISCVLILGSMSDKKKFLSL